MTLSACKAECRPAIRMPRWWTLRRGCTHIPPGGVSGAKDPTPRPYPCAPCTWGKRPHLVPGTSENNHEHISNEQEHEYCLEDQVRRRLGLQTGLFALRTRAPIILPQVQALTASSSVITLGTPPLVATKPTVDRRHLLAGWCMEQNGTLGRSAHWTPSGSGSSSTRGLLATYHSVRKCKESLVIRISTHMFLYLRAQWHIHMMVLL